eukprot:2289238-Pleurochrysis_carterae.AAC.1
MATLCEFASGLVTGNPHRTRRPAHRTRVQQGRARVQQSRTRVKRRASKGEARGPSGSVGDRDERDAEHALCVRQEGTRARQKFKTQLAQSAERDIARSKRYRALGIREARKVAAHGMRHAHA